MGKIFKNIILMLLLFAVIIMMIGILFYDYLPTRVEVSKPNEYEEDSKVTKTLATIEKEKKEVFNNKETGNSTSGTVIQAYSLDAHDLSVYEQAGMYDSGKVNPFADLSSGNSNNSGNANSGNANSGNSNSGNSNSGNSNSGNTVTSNGGTTSTNKGNTTADKNNNNINTNTLTEVKDNTILNSGNSK